MSLGDRLQQTAVSMGLSEEPIARRIGIEQPFTYHLSKPEISALAITNGYYDIAEHTHPLYRPPDRKDKETLKEAQTALNERMSEQIRVMGMDKGEMTSYAASLGLADAVKGMDAVEMAKVILSRGVSKEEYDEMVESRQQARIENLAQKWTEVEKFGARLPEARKAYRKDLQKKGLTKDRVLATVIALMDESLMRIGSDESATGQLSMSGKQTFGASTLSPDMLDQDKLRNEGVAEFDFIGKKQIVQSKRIEDEDVLDVLIEILDDVWGPGKPGCKGKGGKKLFCYEDGDKYVPITDKEVRKYLDKIAGTTHTHFFRFWHGTNIVKDAMKECRSYSDAVSDASIALGHMRTNPKTGEMVPDTGNTAQKSYIDPKVILRYGAGRGERLPVYCDVRDMIEKEGKEDTSGWGREDIIGYLKEHPKSKAWERFLD